MQLVMWVNVSLCCVQEILNFTSTLGIYVRMRGGLDTLRREASWVLQALDPVTGKELMLFPFS